MLPFSRNTFFASVGLAGGAPILPLVSGHVIVILNCTDTPRDIAWQSWADLKREPSGWLCESSTKRGGERSGD